MQRPVIYIGFGGGDLANYWPASYVPEVINAGQLLVDGDLTPQFRYFNTARPLTYEVAVVGASSFQIAWVIGSNAVIQNGVVQ